MNDEAIVHIGEVMAEWVRIAESRGFVFQTPEADR